MRLAGCLSTLSTKGMGDGPCTSAQNRSSQGHHLQDEAGNCTRSCALGLCVGLPRGVVLMDAGYGPIPLCVGVYRTGPELVASILPETSVWALRTGPRPPKKWSGNGRSPKLLRRDSKHRPISVTKLAIGPPAHAWHKITCREGTAEQLSSRFARVRVRPAPVLVNSGGPSLVLRKQPSGSMRRGRLPMQRSLRRD
ncbi:hypothetical protein ACVIHH_000063 [Bradyrhizobium sp. USDA 4518]